MVESSEAPTEGEKPEEDEEAKEAETEAPLPQIEIPPNTIV